MEKIIKVEEIIVDLYEMRARLIRPMGAGEKQDLSEMHRYNFFSQAIANLCDKYKIKTEDIEKVIRERNIENRLPNPNQKH